MMNSLAYKICWEWYPPM